MSFREDSHGYSAESSETGSADDVETIPAQNHGDRRLSAARGSLKPPLLHEDMHDHVASPVRTAPRPGRLSRTLLNFWLDGLLGVVFAFLCVAAVIVQFVFPPGIAARGWSLWGLSYGQWCSLQFGLIAVLGLAVLVHIMLHWTWVCSVWTKRILRRPLLPDDGIRTIYGVGLLICVLIGGAVVIGIAQWMIVRSQ